MAMFDEFVEKATMVADVAAKKTQKAVTISSLKLKSVTINYEIKEAYQRLGTAVYNMKKKDYNDLQIINNIIDEIDEYKKQLEELNEKILKMKEN